MENYPVCLTGIIVSGSVKPYSVKQNYVPSLLQGQKRFQTAATNLPQLHNPSLDLCAGVQSYMLRACTRTLQVYCVVEERGPKTD